MMSERVGNRLLVVIGGVVVQICLGTIYAWSIFQSALVATHYSWPATNALLPFAAGLASFAGFMVLAGRWQDRAGPRKVATFGGLLLGLGYILASLIDMLALDTTTGTLFLIMTYGLVGGAGIGFAYVCPIAALVKWFPDKKGAITGVAVAGFGGGALVFSYVEEYLIALNGGLVGTPFLTLGLIYLVVVIGGSQLLRNPPAGWTPPGFVPKPTTADASGVSLTPREMIRTSRFKMLWLMFFLAATAGLMTLGMVKSAAADVDPLVVPLFLGPLIAGIMSIFNAAGRIVWGTISDRIGRRLTMTIMFLVLSMAMFSFALVASLPPAEGRWIVVTVIASTVGFCFGGNFALFPSATADYFGTSNVGKNYGVVFTAYGFAGILGALVAGYMKDWTGSYYMAFIITGILAIFAMLVTLFLKKTEKEQ
ncbi:MAG: OFA family MFS transporter [Candidatus Thorarchaeota archaeon]